jgi:peroxiredoxin
MLKFEGFFEKTFQNPQNHSKLKDRATSLHFKALSDPNAKIKHWGFYHGSTKTTIHNRTTLKINNLI